MLNPRSVAGVLVLALASCSSNEAEQPQRSTPSKADIEQTASMQALDAGALTARGVVAMRLGNYDGAIADCTRAIEMASPVLGSGRCSSYDGSYRFTAVRPHSST